MDRKFSSNVYYFVGVLFFVVAWRIAPGAAAGHGTWYMLSALLAFAAMSITLEGVRAAVPEPSTFAGRVGRILWVLRPRAWVLAWVLIVWAASVLEHRTWRGTIRRACRRAYANISGSMGFARRQGAADYSMDAG